MSRRRVTRPLRPGTVVDVEDGPDGRWYVRRVTGAAATKPYRCPGCQQLLPAATPHVVAWPADDPADGLDSRRHWHAPCWARRDRRRSAW